MWTYPDWTVEEPIVTAQQGQRRGPAGSLLPVPTTKSRLLSGYSSDPAGVRRESLPIWPKNLFPFGSTCARFQVAEQCPSLGVYDDHLAGDGLSRLHTAVDRNAFEQC